MTARRVLRMGMVGGGRDAFIGAVHRIVASMDGRAQLVAGCLSSTPEKAVASGEDLGLPRDRNYPTWQAMLEGESKLPRDQRIDFVSIVTPNHLHFPVARAFAAAQFHVVCDKPMVHAIPESMELIELVRTTGVVFAVTYNYSGYPLVRQAREMVRAGAIGTIRKIVVEYHQGWLATPLETSGQKQASWRTDPRQAGVGGAIGDIGSHAEQLMSFITGLELESIAADLTTFVPGRAVDDDASLLLRFAPRDGIAARGVLTVSQIENGCENDLRITVSGTMGTIHWAQEQPNVLSFRRLEGPEQLLRSGNSYLSEMARMAVRLPPGHPEGFLEAFANIYNAAFDAMLAETGGLTAGEKFGFPDVIDGARGVHFIAKAVESSRSDSKWTSARFQPPATRST